jgi:hypothetical protein
VQVQLQGSSAGSVLNNTNVIFDTIILDAANYISYDITTGIFTISTPGKYLVHWWINTDGAEGQLSVIFKAEIGATAIAASSSEPSTALQLYGQGLFEVGSVPVLLSLVNRTGATVVYGTATVQADLVVFKL